jgi:hypothetical protein
MNSITRATCQTRTDSGVNLETNYRSVRRRNIDDMMMMMMLMISNADSMLCYANAAK